jgi:hypothetical protein
MVGPFINICDGENISERICSRFGCQKITENKKRYKGRTFDTFDSVQNVKLLSNSQPIPKPGS